MFRFVRPVTWLVIVACLWVAASVAVEVATTYITGSAINAIETIHRSEGALAEGFWAWMRSDRAEAVRLRSVIYLLSALIVAMLITRFYREIANAKMSMHMVYHIREAVYDKLQRVGFGFHDAISTGQLINRALSDLQNVRQFIQTAIVMTLEIVLVVLGYIAVMFKINPWLALMSLVPLPIWTWYILRFSKQVQPVAKSVMNAEDRNVSILTENIAGVHVVKAFATEGAEVRKYNENVETFKARVLERIRMFANFQPVIRAIAMGANMGLFIVAGALVIRGSLQVGYLVVLGGAMGAILGRLQQVSTINEQYQLAIVSARRLYEVLTAPATVPEKPDALPLPRGRGSVEFRDVTFGYTADKPVLSDINFRVEGGSVVAVVGPTGAGKTTLVNLISRFYDPQQGAVLIDGVDLRDAKLASIRTEVAFVFQETFLFSDTVTANIAYGRPGVLPVEPAWAGPPGEVEAAARLAQAHEFIEQLPKGYETLLGERGASLSGGQRQRLAIARAILLNPRILVLDDATAAIDPETEDLIRRGMRFVMYGRTTFIIAHRISTVKNADVVIVLESGRITQIGTHDELMEQSGHYREIAVAQLFGDEQDEERQPIAAESPSHMRRVADPARVDEAVAGAGKEESERGAESV
jgi:ABC-type multidrug transport system fused ATPase/permease subunit